ncbi:MAG: two-component sensor histidine kinase [Crocinitomix sp.]|jgi:two-component sensor histidine kinase
MHFNNYIAQFFKPRVWILVFLLLAVKVGFSKTFTLHPELEGKAKVLLVQDAEKLVTEIDIWVDSLQSNPNEKTWMHLMLYKAEGLITISNYVAAIQLIELVQSKAIKADVLSQDAHLQFRILSLSANCYILRNERSIGLDSLQKAIKIAEEGQEYEDLVIGHVLMAEGLRPTEMNRNTIKHLNTAEQLCIIHDLGPNLFAYVYDRYAACSTVHEVIVSYSYKAIEAAEKGGNRGIIGAAHLQLGMILPTSIEIRDSLIDIGLENFRLLGDRRNIALAMLDKSKLYITEGDDLKALVFLDSVDYYRENRKWPYLTQASWHSKIDIYRKNGEKDSAIVYLDKLNNYIGQMRRTSELEVLFFVEKKFQDEIQAVTIREQDYRIEKGERTFRLIMLSLIISAVFLIVLIYFTLRLRKGKREIENKQRQIAIINTDLEASLEENKVLLYETHHRVKNNLQVVSSLLELQSESANNKLLENALSGAQNRIGAMAFVHELLYKQDDVKNVDLAQYIKAMSNQIAGFYGDEENLSVKVICHNIQFPLHRAIHLGIFINELLTNSHKYARKPNQKLEIQIELIQKENHNHLSYHDNGPGLTDGMDSGNIGSIGIYLLKSMAKQLRGELHYYTDEGATFEMKFKK